MTALALGIGAFAVLLGSWALYEARQTPGPPPALGILQESVTAHARMLDDLTERPEANLDPFVELLTEFAGRMDQYERDLEEGLDVSRRREARVRQAVHRALQKYEEDGEIDPGLAALAGEIQPADGDGGPEEGVQPVPEGMDWDQPSSIPGVSLGQLRQARMK